MCKFAVCKMLPDNPYIHVNICVIYMKYLTTNESKITQMQMHTANKHKTFANNRVT